MRYLLHYNEGVLLKNPSGIISDRSFSVAAPTLWNTLPVSLRSKRISTFKSNLKTYLLKLAFNIS